MNMRTQRPNATKVPSLSTMGYMTLIVALVPGVTAFAGLPKPIQKMAAPNSVSSGTGSTCTTLSNRSFQSTQLNYVSGANHDHTVNSSPQKGGDAWWSSIFGNKDQGSAADEYLEFLDRRYNRILHDEDEKRETKGFSALNWLYQGAKEEVDASALKQNEDDALYVLGVANLASKKFLQKHHKLRLADEQAKSGNGPTSKPTLVTDAEIVDSTSTHVSVAPVVALFHHVVQRRQNFVHCQSKQIRLALAFTLKTFMTSPVKAVRKLFIMGGGKQSMALTVAAMAALSILLRPLLKVVVNEGANMLSP